MPPHQVIGHGSSIDVAIAVVDIVVDFDDQNTIFVCNDKSVRNDGTSFSKKQVDVHMHYNDIQHAIQDKPQEEEKKHGVPFEMSCGSQVKKSINAKNVALISEEECKDDTALCDLEHNGITYMDPNDRFDILRDGFRRISSLSTIPEEEEAHSIDAKNENEFQQERRVAFATRDVKCDNRIIGVLDSVDVIEIPHFSEYTTEQKGLIWYSREELDRMKELSLETIRKTIELLKCNQTHQFQRHHKSEEVGKESKLYFRFFYLRGLERFFDHHTGNRKTANRRYSAAYAVLKEQYNQRVECFQQYGKSCNGVYDAERLKLAYQSDNLLKASLEEAQYVAKQDEILAKEQCYYNSNDNDDLIVDIYNNNNDCHQQCHYQKKKSWVRSFLSSQQRKQQNRQYPSMMPILDALELPIHDIFWTMIQRMMPFVELRSKGDIFWAIDHNIEEICRS